MSKERTGQPVFIDGAVIDLVDAARPHGMSRTSWINYLIQEGAVALKRRNEDQQ